jgi:hypothetical protein
MPQSYILAVSTFLYEQDDSSINCFVIEITPEFAEQLVRRMNKIPELAKTADFNNLCEIEIKEERGFFCRFKDLKKAFRDRTLSGTIDIDCRVLVLPEGIDLSLIKRAPTEDQIISIRQSNVLWEAYPIPTKGKFVDGVLDKLNTQVVDFDLFQSIAAGEPLPKDYLIERGNPYLPKERLTPLINTESTELPN